MSFPFCSSTSPPFTMDTRRLFYVLVLFMAAMVVFMWTYTIQINITYTDNVKTSLLQSQNQFIRNIKEVHVQSPDLTAHGYPTGVYQWSVNEIIKRRVKVDENETLLLTFRLDARNQNVSIVNVSKVVDPPRSPKPSRRRRRRQSNSAPKEPQNIFPSPHTNASTNGTKPKYKRLSDEEDWNNLPDFAKSLPDNDPNFKFNWTGLIEFRDLLEREVRSSDLFVMTQRNTPVNSTVRYFVDKSRYVITDELNRKLPKESPFADKRFRNCSIVGSGGILSNSNCGKQIDSARFIIRFNVAPVMPEYRRDIGSRTSLVTCNGDRLREKWRKFRTDYNIHRFMGHLDQYDPDVYIWSQPFTSSTHTNALLQIHDILRIHNKTQRAIYNRPEHQGLARSFWRRQGVYEMNLTSGLLMVTTAIALCDEVYIYGFWPWLVDKNNSTIRYHYAHRGITGGLRNRWHHIDREFEKLTELHHKGLIKLVTGKCQDKE
ncbi:alpha-N-acetylneuraminide alpha-2,8-sialyltransferase-like isoform X2 [Branchiostoma floridae]|uniref:Alpha-N-acetylneuraminide alpha-2,8-sialyltransferase-like isoform X2 n=1 Tax=Branchiostoma floridae TaxID=7739 RepID=A0A9J7LRN6_BRAFL|nr:alpha-N-acetylneuraminide alpha-2,8-sialyltransferase-like isoform X2 [Branchiostoma floridae]